MIEFFVEGIPAPQGSKNGYKRGKHIVLVESSKKLPEWRKRVSAEAQRVMGNKPFIEQPVEVLLDFVMPCPKSRKPGSWMETPADLDKLIRACGDSMSKIVYKDDSYIVKIGASKRRANVGEPTGVHIKVRLVESRNVK